MTNSKQKIVISARLDLDVWQKLEKAKEQYRKENKNKKIATGYINSLLVNRAIDIFYSDNAFEEISNIIGLKPKKIDISGWIEKNWQNFRIIETDRNDEYYLKYSGEIDFDVKIETVRNAELDIIEIKLIYDNSSCIPGCELVWNIESLNVLSDFLN